MFNVSRVSSVSVHHIHFTDSDNDSESSNSIGSHGINEVTHL